MTEYYYTNDPTAAHEYQQLQFNYAGHTLLLQTDSGVFSKKRVDFGTATLLKACEKITLPKGDLLDVGCGYGALSLPLAAVDKTRKCDLVDVNERALALARHNAQQNDLPNINVFTSSCYDNVTKTDYSVIVTNPPIRAGKQVVHTILADSYSHLRPGGMILAVLQKKQGAPSAKQKLTEVFGNCTVVLKNKGYFILQSIKEAD